MRKALSNATMSNARNQQKDPAVVLSKRLSFALRHGAVKMGLNIGSDGNVVLSELLRHNDFRGYSVADVKSVVDSNDKKRFEITAIDGTEMIRAAQGHTIRSVNDEELLTEITDPSMIPMCIHGTYERALPLILETGLNRMSRNHIHFAPGLPAEDGVISGMRSSCEVIIVIDTVKAMAAGIKFYMSSNNVILTSGIDGVLPAEYIKEVIHRRPANNPGSKTGKTIKLPV